MSRAEDEFRAAHLDRAYEDLRDEFVRHGRVPPSRELTRHSAASHGRPELDVIMEMRARLSTAV